MKVHTDARASQEANRAPRDTGGGDSRPATPARPAGALRFVSCGPLAAAGVSMLAAFAAYATSLPGTFQFDDVSTVLGNPALRSLSELPRYFVDPSLFSGLPGNAMYRPVLLTSYLADYLVGGYSPLVWHLTNVLLHGLCAGLVVLVAYRLFRMTTGSGLAPAPLFAGLVFALHPVHSEVVDYVSARSCSLATMWVLAALLLYLSWREEGRSRRSRALCLSGCLLCFALGLGSKEIAVVFVPVAVVVELLDPAAGGWRRRLTRAAIRAVPAVAVLVGYLFLRRALLGAATASIGDRLMTASKAKDLNSGAGRSVFENLITQARVFWMYVRLLLFPVGLAVDRFVRVSRSILEPSVLASLAGIALVLIALVRSVRRRPILALGGAIFLLGLAPTSSLIPLNVVMNEHRLYLPDVGLAVLAGLGCAALLRIRPRLGSTALAFVGVCFLLVIVPRNRAWQSERSLWEADIAVSPRSYRAHNELGVYWYDRAVPLGPVPAAVPLLRKAIAEYRKAEALYPRWYNPHLNLGIAYRALGQTLHSDDDFRVAIHEFERCTEVVKHAWRARYQIATTYGKWQKYDEAIRLFKTMADEDRKGPTAPRASLYLFPMAKLSMEKGDLAAAERLYREILSNSPEEVDAALGLATAFSRSGRVEEGTKIMRRFAAERPKDPNVHLAMADYYDGLNPPDRAGAAREFRLALRFGHRPTPKELARYLGRR